MQFLNTSNSRCKWGKNPLNFGLIALFSECLHMKIILIFPKVPRSPTPTSHHFNFVKWSSEYLAKDLVSERKTVLSQSGKRTVRNFWMGSFALLKRPFYKLDMTRGQGQWPRVTGTTEWNQCALPLEKSVHLLFWPQYPSIFKLWTSSYHETISLMLSLPLTMGFQEWYLCCNAR